MEVKNDTERADGEHSRMTVSRPHADKISSWYDRLEEDNTDDTGKEE